MLGVIGTVLANQPATAWAEATGTAAGIGLLVLAAAGCAKAAAWAARTWRERAKARRFEAEFAALAAEHLPGVYAGWRS